MAKSRIIKELASGKVSLETGLKQLKVLLTEFNKSEILRWVNCEIQGYEDSDTVPEYRIIAGNLIGTFMNYQLKCTNVGIPLKVDASDKMVNICTDVKLYDSISALKMLTDSSKEIGKQIPASYLPYIQQYSAISMTALLSAFVRISQIQIENIFSKVENTILDVLLLLENEFGNLDELDIDLSTKNEEEIESITNNIMVLLYNDNSITIGDNNKMKDTNISTAR